MGLTSHFTAPLHITPLGTRLKACINPHNISPPPVLLPNASASLHNTSSCNFQVATAVQPCHVLLSLAEGFSHVIAILTCFDWLRVFVQRIWMHYPVIVLQLHQNYFWKDKPPTVVGPTDSLLALIGKISHSRLTHSSLSFPISPE